MSEKPSKRARGFVEAEAEESDDAEDESEQEEEEDGEDLAGFIQNDDDEKGDDDASDSDTDDEERALQAQDLDEDDLAVLADAGLDTKRVKKRQEQEENDLFGDDDDEPSSKRHKPFDDALHTGLVAVKASRDAIPDDDSDVFSDAGSADSFIVDDGGRSKKRSLQEEAAEFDITEEQMKEVMDIFGDTSVLRPLDETGPEDPNAKFRASIEVPGSPAEAEDDLPLPPGNTFLLPTTDDDPPKMNQEVVTVDDGADPNLQEKMYESRYDFQLEVADVPERWIQAYYTERELLDKEGVRVWTDEEHECEATWIYMQAFWKKQYAQEASEKALRRILDMLHTQRLEPIYIITQCTWEFSSCFYVDDLWKIFELDHRWQTVWLLYHRINEMTIKHDRTQLPVHIVVRAERKIFEQSHAELELKDTYDWFSVMYPEAPPSSDKEGSGARMNSEAKKLASIRELNFDEKLGIKDSIDVMSLKVFGIAPQELGKNVEIQQQAFKPEGGAYSEDLKVDEVCEKHKTGLDGAFPTKEAVRDAVTLYLSRLIASEPRIRKFVRAKFRDMCAISTMPTELGKPVAHDAAQSFRKSYRAFHLVNRPVSSLKEGDVLFLDILNLQRKGFLSLEYSLVKRESQSKSSMAYAYVMLGHDTEDVVNKRRHMTEHFRKLTDATYFPPDEKELMKWNWCEQMRPRLEAVARSHEVETRRKGAEGGETKERAAVLFKCASMTFGFDHLNSFMTEDPIYEALQNLYCKVESKSETEVFVPDTEWNQVRKQVLLRALRDELYPMFWGEVQSDLARNAEAEVCRQCSASFLKIIDMQPRRLTLDEYTGIKEQRKYIKYGAEGQTAKAVAHDSDSDSDGDPDWSRDKKCRMEGCNSVLSIVPITSEESSVVVFLNPFGDPVDMRMLFKTFLQEPVEITEKNQGNQTLLLREEKKKEHRETFCQMVKRHKPSIILLPLTDNQVPRMKEQIENILALSDMEKVFKVKPVVLFGDPTVPRIIAYHPRLMEEGIYRDFKVPQQRIAISAARFCQDPLVEVCQLWHELPSENGIFKLRLHRLQEVVPKIRLQRSMMQPLMETVAKSGVHLNRIRWSPHLGSIIPFVAGLGPRKARVLLRCMNESITSRKDISLRLQRHFQRTQTDSSGLSCVAVNCLPFFKICPDIRDRWESDLVDSFDKTRLSEPLRAWIMSLAEEALKIVDEEAADLMNAASDSDEEVLALRTKKVRTADHLTEAMKLYHRDPNFEKTLQDAFLDEWSSKVPSSGDLNTLLNSLLIPEILAPFKDNRQDFQELDETMMTHLMLGEPDESFEAGSIVHAIVQKDLEFDANSKATADEPRIEVKCKIMPSNVNGRFKKMHRIGAEKQGYYEGCNKEFKPGEPVLARLLYTKGSGNLFICQLSVDTDADIWLKQFPLLEEDTTYFVPVESENWLKIKLGSADDNVQVKKEKLKDWVRRPRNIRHANWVDLDHEKAIEYIDKVPLGNVLFRPSRRHDVIVAMLKVHPTDTNQAVDPAKCFRVFDVKEMSEKTESKGFEVAKDLQIDGVKYRDFDEIIARHMDPIMENLRLLQEHPRYGLQNGQVIDRYEVRYAVQQFTLKDKKTLHYVFILHDNMPGHALLVWALAGRKPFEDLIEITPAGFSLWNQQFETMANLIQWFKNVGWRNSSRCRKDFKEHWEQRMRAAKERRGEDALAGKKPKFGGFGQTATTSGLQTPSGGLSTPTFYTAEASAATPRGLSTPGAHTGYRTPDPSAPGAPATPRGVPSTPFGAPATPAGIPATPLGLRGAPGTPAALRVNSTSAGAMPSTPAGVGGHRTMPATPAGLFGRPGLSMPATPAGPPPGTPAFPNFNPSTPFGVGAPRPGGRAAPSTPGLPPPQ